MMRRFCPSSSAAAVAMMTATCSSQLARASTSKGASGSYYRGNTGPNVIKNNTNTNNTVTNNDDSLARNTSASGAANSDLSIKKQAKIENRRIGLRALDPKHYDVPAPSSAPSARTSASGTRTMPTSAFIRSQAERGDDGQEGVVGKRASARSAHPIGGGLSGAGSSDVSGVAESIEEKQQAAIMSIDKMALRQEKEQKALNGDAKVIAMGDGMGHEGTASAHSATLKSNINNNRKKSSSLKESTAAEPSAASSGSIGRKGAKKRSMEANKADEEQDWSMGYTPESPSRMEHRRVSAASNTLNHYDDSASLDWETDDIKTDGRTDDEKNAISTKSKEKQIKEEEEGEEHNYNSTNNKSSSNQKKVSDDEEDKSVAESAYERVKDVVQSVEDRLEDSTLGRYFTGHSSSLSGAADETVGKKESSSAGSSNMGNDDGAFAARHGAFKSFTAYPSGKPHSETTSSAKTFTDGARRSSTAGTASVTAAIASMFSRGSSATRNASASNSSAVMAHDHNSNPSMRAAPASSFGGGGDFYQQQSEGAYATASQSQSGLHTKRFATEISSPAADANPFAAETVGAGARGKESGSNDPYHLASARKSGPTDYSSADYLIRRS